MAFGYYNTGYPQYYQQPYQQPVPDQLAQLRQQYQQPVQMQPMQQPTDDRIWVQGENAATAYLVAPNGFVRLWDSTAPTFYEKRADAQGKPLPMDVYDYTRRGGEPAKQEPTDLTRRLEALETRISALEGAKTESE